jgi:hypothetical protein
MILGSIPVVVTNMTKREILKQNLAWLSLYGDNHLRTFRFMYSYKNIYASINEIVDNMSDNWIDWALTQTQNSLDKKQQV